VPVTVLPFEGMDDETGIKHLEHRHGDRLAQMNLRFRPEPDRSGKAHPRRFRAGKMPWDLFHARLHDEAREHKTDLGHNHDA
jgi:hypothetical protein